ncbi:unnamed protein product [Somion occarium]|uniref:RRM domain-containing protein n=1 Tax=Somion occarium TaxID=3059160 RepID=A0ABP1D1M1_9APHY
MLQHIQYAKSRSYATFRKEDPNYVPPTSFHAKETISRLGNGLVAVNGQKRQVDRIDEGERESKRERTEENEDEEMEIEEDEEEVVKEVPSQNTVPPAVQQPSARLLCTNLPQEVTDDVLSVLFQQYQGFQSTHVVVSPTPNAQGQKVKMAQAIFDSPELASVAKESLDGFALKKGWAMSVAYI